ncbi:hypothetical protein SAMN02745119_00765 [Trichlorobacter thiogenes]|uniref:Uncharacterized protein n=1 Tax=Trichlorobacter thiogenes TaxID=115783 RepID=A0A1T4L4X4_9BACT|nr:hypothetical protein [Trichlorobacter thiogenes]SJZ49663.1 hypothetical protein SAMN02745119_00765 [Trichlorobacter thiogenes]
MSRLFVLFLLVITFAFTSICSAEQRNDPREQAMSDSLDLWREGRFELLYDSLSHRSGMTRERFVQNMKDAEIKPVCCFNKLTAFRLISEKRTTAKVFAKLGMEGSPGIDESQSREFTLDHEEGRWKVRLADIKGLAGLKKKKSHVTRVKKYYH